ncbi:S8 family serine peptidase [Catenulispora sp. NF23]|uniref:S8 family serine peptidase n=1 Tax=Catenulispora pinistramenti TaxID=2705254 RepID=A0ABS5L7R6_9ACTN|nr:S8 family serine peptidase [Catenulispora pinistramenti]MBS2538968.1 S8 family serine peptidase [Catenulispora pinistramenti]MBS2554115.1 S8 family serine peptidase [Catenulispora pinistramenti]
MTTDSIEHASAPAEAPPHPAPLPHPPHPARLRSSADPARLTWSLRGRTPGEIALSADGADVTPEWAWGGSTGRGIRVCVVDSGVERDHPDVGTVDGSWVVVGDEDGFRVVPTDTGDMCGHGTACASIVRRLAPDCELHSVRVLGERFSGTGDVLLAGLRWAVQQRFDVVNLSLSTTRAKFAQALHELADEAYFGGTALVASAHNTPVESFPWRFSSVFSVGSHQETDQDLHLYNPEPPVEFFAAGQNVSVAWLGGKTIRTTGNSFATPFVTGTCARILAKHPGLTLFQLKSVLYLTAANVQVDTRGAA